MAFCLHKSVQCTSSTPVNQVKDPSLPEIGNYAFLAMVKELPKMVPSDGCGHAIICGM